MSRRYEQELRAVATRAATEAVINERARCMWVLDELLKKAVAGASKALLSPTELQVAKVRAEITRTMTMAAKSLIASGIRPPPKPVGPTIIDEASNLTKEQFDAIDPKIKPKIQP